VISAFAVPIVTAIAAAIAAVARVPEKRIVPVPLFSVLLRSPFCRSDRDTPIVSAQKSTVIVA
jgi:hypothetical protein